MAAQSDDVFKQLFTGLIVKREIDLILVWDVGLVHKHLNGGEYFHGDWEGFAGIFVLVGMGKILELLFELVEDMSLGDGL